MKIGIQTWGSNGDTRPLLALADGLRKAGHQVMLVVSSIDNRSYQAECRQLGIEYRQVPEHIAFDMEGFAQRSFRMNPLQWLKALLDEAFFPTEECIYEAAKTLVDDCDYVIGHHFLYPLKLAAAKGQKPFYSVTFCHAAIASPSVPPFGFPNLGRLLNPISWHLLDILFDWMLKEPLTRLWQTDGLPMPKHLLGDLLTSQRLNLIAADPLFCLGREAWPDYHQCCGFLELTADSQDWDFPSALSDFIDAGTLPVYMTFGSLQQAVPEWSMDLFVRAVELAGCRAIIQTSSERYSPGSRSESIYFVGRHPHQPVFARCAAVVHHGGAGTTHAATRAGCPSVVVPFMDEQLFWGRQLQRLGLADKPLPAKIVRAEALAKAITRILTDFSYRAKALALHSRMQASNGVDEAVRLLSAEFNRQ